MANRRRKRDTRRSRRDRKGEPAKRKVPILPSPRKANITRGTTPRLPEPSGGVLREDSEHQQDGMSAEPPGMALGDLRYVRKDLVRILSLAGVMLLVLVVTAVALG